jgi:hypothetical protein
MNYRVQLSFTGYCGYVVEAADETAAIAAAEEKYNRGGTGDWGEPERWPEADMVEEAFTAVADDKAAEGTTAAAESKAAEGTAAAEGTTAAAEVTALLQAGFFFFCTIYRRVHGWLRNTGTDNKEADCA